VLAKVLNSGLALPSGLAGCVALAPFVVAPVSEVAMGQDLNGDGDTTDQVIHSLDVLTDAKVNAGLASVGPYVANDLFVLFLVPESGQGNVDLSGDGDTADAVWFLFDPAQPLGGNNPRSLGVPAQPVPTAAAGTTGGFVFTESEAAAGIDRNLDGDKADDIVVAVATTGPIAPFRSALARSPIGPYAARAGRALFTLTEPGNAADLNGDGDTSDVVLGSVDFTTGLAALRFIGAGGRARSVGTLPYALTDGAAVYLIDEASEGATDVNLDGDATDAVVGVYTFSSLSEQRPVTPLLAQLGVSASPPLGVGTGPHRAIVGALEAGQGAAGKDLNGDGDTADAVLGWIDTLNAPGSLHVLAFALAPVPATLDGTRGIVAGIEGGQGVGGTDHNGDGDVGDLVALLVDMPLAPGTATSLGFATAGAQISGADAIVGVPEGQQAGLDLSGDGDPNDIVPFHFDLSDVPPTFRSLAAPTNGLAFFRFAANDVRIASVVPEGQSANFPAFNADGDTLDAGLVLFGSDPSVSPPVATPLTPFIAGLASSFSQAPLQVGTRVFAWPTSESMAGADLNGDADLSDTVLRYVRYEVP
jgi:hypothetical protein